MRKNKTLLLSSLIGIAFSLCADSLYAKAAFTEAESKLLRARQTYSVRVYPNIITNLRKPKPQVKLKYILIKMDLITLSEAEMHLVEYHMPLIKDRLIVLIMKQSRHNFASQSRRDNLKLKMIKTINEALFNETKKNFVTEIIFQKITIE